METLFSRLGWAILPYSILIFPDIFSISIELFVKKIAVSISSTEHTRCFYF